MTKSLLPRPDIETQRPAILFDAVQHGHKSRTREEASIERSIFELLVQDSRIDLAYRDPWNGRTVLSWAAEAGYDDYIQILFKSDRTSMTRTLLEDPGDGEGRTPAWLAARRGHASTIELICRRQHASC